MEFPLYELPLKNRIHELMKEWKTYCDAKPEWKGKFVSDGFFPYYTELDDNGQNVRVLFIGRESYGLSEEDYIESYNGMKTANFHNRLLYLAYGIIHGQYTENDWINMDEATVLDKIFAEPKCKGGFSYAFMNASKISNETDNPALDETQFENFIRDKKNLDYMASEIQLLTPDIIVSANLGDLGFFKYFENAKKSENSSDHTKNRCVYHLKVGSKDIPWVDGWHFSAYKRTYESFYSPICSIAKDLLNKKQS